MKKLIQKWQEGLLYTYVCNKALKKGKAEPFSEEFYKSLTTEVLGKEYGDILKTANTSGQCYFYSLLLAKAMPNSTLVVGTLNNLNSTIRNEYYEEFGHGWVEKDNLVYDTTSRQIFDKAWYYDKFNATVKESHLSNELNNPHLFFRLGVNAVKDRSFLVKPLYEIVKPNLPQILSNTENVKNSLAVVRDDYVKKEIEKYLNPAMKN